mmetsp:Transcript_18006/g.41354  ORF Transcript_18006/g.41354 Transcript_18006/m.41354 type:complete len:337 (+) Transcript_18006:119-1129(+)
MIPRLSNSRNRRDSLGRRVVQVIRRDERQAAFLEQLLPPLDVRALEPDDHGHLEVEAPARLDDPLSYDVALHDPPEYVDEYRLHGRVGRYDLERRLDLVDVRRSSDVEEVGRRAAPQTDDVHRAHRESGPVDHAPDVPVESDVVQVPLPGRDLPGVLLGVIALLEDVPVPELGVVVEADLGVGRDQLAVGVLGEGVHLDHGAVLVDEEVVEGADLAGRVVPRAGHAEAVHDGRDLLVGGARADVDGDLDDLLGTGLGQVLDGRAALAARYDERSAGRAVHEDGEVELLSEAHLLRQQQRVHRLARRTRLLRHERPPQHPPGVLPDLGRLYYVNAAL